MNILIHNKELKEKLQDLLDYKNEKQVNKITIEIELKKIYGNRNEYKSVIKDTVSILYNRDLSLKRLLKIEEFLDKENIEKDYLFNILEKKIKNRYEIDKTDSKKEKIGVIVLLFCIISIYSIFNINWSFIDSNSELPLWICLVVIGLTIISVFRISYSWGSIKSINYYNKKHNLKKSYFLEIAIGLSLIILGGIHFYFKNSDKEYYSNSKQNYSYSPKQINNEKSQPQQKEVSQTSKNNLNNKYIPSLEEANNMRYDTYYNNNYGYSMDYPDDNYFKISANYENGMEMRNDNGEVYISLSYDWDKNGENLQEAYNRAVSERPNAPYKFLGKTFFTITYPENGLLIFRKTVYDKVNGKYIYLYVSFPPEYKEYMTPIVEKMANSMKKHNTNISYNNDVDSDYERKFGRVVNDKYVGGSFIEFLKNADQNEYYYLRDQFWEILSTMYITQDNKTYYYLNNIIDQLETKADWDKEMKTIFLEVQGNKLYYTVGFPKEYNANTPSWIQFEIFERKFKDGIGLRTAHVGCAINGVEYKDWEAIEAIYR